VVDTKQPPPATAEGDAHHMRVAVEITRYKRMETQLQREASIPWGWWKQAEDNPLAHSLVLGLANHIERVVGQVAHFWDWMRGATTEALAQRLLQQRRNSRERRCERGMPSHQVTHATSLSRMNNPKQPEEPVR
jgi:hypothetical protein